MPFTNSQVFFLRLVTFFADDLFLLLLLEIAVFFRTVVALKLVDFFCFAFLREVITSRGSGG